MCTILLMQSWNKEHGQKSMGSAGLGTIPSLCRMHSPTSPIQVRMQAHKGSVNSLLVLVRLSWDTWSIKACSKANGSTCRSSVTVETDSESPASPALLPPSLKATKSTPAADKPPDVFPFLLTC